MATIPPKKFTLRAFRIANPNLTESNSGILRLLEQVLTPIECLEANRIVEEQLKQEMERFLSEIRNQQNG